LGDLDGLEDVSMEEHDVSGYTITDADRDFANALGFVAPEALPLHIARFRTKALKAAKAQPEPVPGAAVRALVDELLQYERDNTPTDEPHMRGCACGAGVAARKLEAALRADAVVAELPTRKELVRRYVKFSCGDRRSDVDVAVDFALSLLAQHAAQKPTESAPRFQVTQAEWSDALSYDSDDKPWQLFKHVNTVLARRAATDVVRPALCTLEQARDITGQICADLGVTYAPPDAAELVRAAINAELQPGIGEAEALRKRVAELESKHALELANNHETVATLNAALEEARSAVTSYSNSYGKAARRAQDAEGKLQTIFNLSPTLAADDAVGVAVLLRNRVAELERKVADVETQLANVTAERDRWQSGSRHYLDLCSKTHDEAKNAGAPNAVTEDGQSRGLYPHERVAIIVRERDEALAKLAKAEHESSAVVCALDDADVPGVVGVDSPVLDCVDKPAVVVGETCGAPGRIKWLANQLEFHRGATEHAEKLIAQLREKLAARPEPVAIDEALAERVCQFYWGDFAAVLGPDAGTMTSALRHAFEGTHASVTVPRGEPQLIDSLVDQNSPAFLRSKLEATEEIARCSRADLEKAQAELEARYAAERHYAVVHRERDQLRAELDECQRKLRQAFDEDVERGHAALQREQELRAELDLSNRNAKEWEAREAAASAELEKTRAELDEMRVSRSRTTEAWETECAQHGTTRSELVACKRELFGAKAYGEQMCKARDRVQERHEALRAAAEHVFDANRRGVIGEALDRLHALLKPASAEAEPVHPTLKAVWGSAKFTHGGEPVQHPPPANDKCARCGEKAREHHYNGACYGKCGEFVQHPPPESAMVDQVQQPLDLPQRVQRLENVVGTFLHEWAQGSFNKARAAEVLETLDARKGSDRG
jgi:hypothetical protein